MNLFHIMFYVVLEFNGQGKKDYIQKYSSLEFISYVLLFINIFFFYCFLKPSLKSNCFIFQ